MNNNDDNKKPLFDSGDFPSLNNSAVSFSTINQSQNINGSNQYHQINPAGYDNAQINDLPKQNQINQNYDGFTMDVPPILGEIPNLNEAVKATAPTGDVLDPMNIMPEKINPVDALDAYEMNYPISGISNDYMMDQMPSLSSPDIVLNHGENSLFDNPELNASGIKTSTDNLDIKRDEFLPIDNEDKNQFVAPQLESLPKIEPLDLDDGASGVFDDNILTSENDTSLPEDEILEIKPLSMPEINDQGTISIPINKIKNLLSELKEDGSKIRVEEFDFENMYQIIIKIDK